MKYLLGLISGLLICVVAFFIVKPTLHEKSFNQGLEEGTSQGYDKGVIQGKVDQKNYDDSMNVAKVKLDTVVKPQKIINSSKGKSRYDINYKMNGNEVAEEISESERE